MKELQIKINATQETSYPIFIEENILNNAYEYINKYTKANRFLLITNDKVYSLYGEKLKNKNTEILILPDGEAYKNMDTLNLIIDKAIEFTKK